MDPPVMVQAAFHTYLQWWPLHRSAEGGLQAADLLSPHVEVSQAQKAGSGGMIGRGSET